MRKRLSTNFSRPWRSFLFLGVVVVLGFVAITELSVDRYWATGHMDDLYIDMSRYDTYLREISEDQDHTEKAASSKTAVPVPAECFSFFDECNELMRVFFQEEYEIDITEQLSQLRVMKAVYPEEISETVGGSYDSGTLYINSVLLDSFMNDIAAGQESPASKSEPLSFKMLRNVYIHETIHYLGFSNKPQFDRFIEAITEALTEMVMDHSGIQYENMTGYTVIKDLAYQIAAADSTLIRNVLCDPSYELGAHFNTVLGADYAETFNKLLLILQSGGARQYREVPYLAQYMTYEYVKQVNGTKEYSQFRVRSIVPNFELKWLLRVHQ